MKRVLAGIICACFVLAGHAQENAPLSLKAEVRMDYQMEKVDGVTDHNHTGFDGKYLNLRLDGRIAHSFSYSWRQRLNKNHNHQNFWDATDWAYIAYEPGEGQWSLSAGKQVVGIGGYEYDRAPIDLYACSEFWNNIPCYAMGGSVTFRSRNRRDQWMAQFCESPFQSMHTEGEMFAYNLMWMGKHGCLSTLYSVNMIEYAPGCFINYLALGHRIELGSVAVEFDWMNRAADHQVFLLRDCSVMGEVAWRCSEKLQLFGKVTYDVNRTNGGDGGRVADYCVMPGTELTMYGGGVEYFPLRKNRDLRLHATCFYTTGQNGNPEGTRLDKQLTCQAGITWRIDLFALTNKLLKH